MIEYIVFSYFVMTLLCIYGAIRYGTIKHHFKMWLVSPLSLPLIMTAKFVNW